MSRRQGLAADVRVLRRGGGLASLWLAVFVTWSGPVCAQEGATRQPWSEAAHIGTGAAQPAPAPRATGDGADWNVQVEFALEPRSENDPWRARTFAFDPSHPDDPEAARVTWLDGLQRQASHLGMGWHPRSGVDMRAPGNGQEIYAFGLGKFVKATAVDSPRSGNPAPRGPLARTASEGDGFVTSLQADGEMANHTYNIFTGDPADGGTVSVLPGGDKPKETAASAGPCSKETCFGRDLIKWNAALRSCTKDVRIGLIDTSFDLSHPAFKKLKAVRKEFIPGAKPSHDDWHGTAILSLLAGDPDSGTPGLVPDATFFLATAFESDAAGNASADTARLLEALDWLDRLGVDVVNMSFSGPQDPAIALAIERMSLKGVVFVAAAGNMGPTAPPSYPAAYPHVIAVTAVNRNGETYRSANRGSYIDMAAPGVDIVTALPEGKQGYRTGTSFAAPFVTAILAVRASSGIVEGTEQHLIEQIAVQDLGVEGRDSIYGVGLALAPSKCPQRVDLVARGPAPSSRAWSKRTKLIRAGALQR